MTGAMTRKDLAVLWASPIPYVAAALFHVVLGVLYVDQLAGRQQAVMQPLFPIAGFLLVIVVPVVAMRAVAEEARSGTLDLLQAVPVAARVVVLGKWLAAWATVIAVVAPAAVFVVLLEAYGRPDRGPIVAGFLGLVLMAGALCAVGVLASSLTSSQPVAAAIAAFTGVLLWFAHSGPDALGATDLLAYVSLSERLRAFAAGAIDTADLGFFVAVTAGALAVAALVVDGRRLR